MYYLPDECCEEAIVPKPDLIRKGLYISGYETAESKELLKQHNITHILNLKGGKELFPQDFTYMILENIADIPGQDLLSHFPRCMKFIEEGIKSGGVLVHCAAGVSRSATIICAYLMFSENLTNEQAFESIRNSRPCVCPNMGFRKQLAWWYQMNFNLEGNTKVHRLYKIHKMASEFERSRQIPETVYAAEDPAIALPSNSSEIIICCSCNRFLFTEDNILENHDRAFTVGNSCDSYFVEPIAWMSTILRSSTCNRGGLGQLRCPNRSCNQVLGNYSFSGIRCSCNVLVYPSFRITRSSVKKHSNILQGNSCTADDNFKFSQQTEQCLLHAVVN